MTVWEYCVLDLGKRRADADERELNDYGRHGWELVAVFFSGTTYAYLKRPVSAEPSSNLSTKKDA